MTSSAGRTGRTCRCGGHWPPRPGAACSPSAPAPAGGRSPRRGAAGGGGGRGAAPRRPRPLWRALAAEAGGCVLDVGAGPGGVTLDLAARGVAVVALDADAELLAALEHRGAGLPVRTVDADARRFALDRRFSL